MIFRADQTSLTYILLVCTLMEPLHENHGKKNIFLNGQLGIDIQSKSRYLRITCAHQYIVVYFINDKN